VDYSAKALRRGSIMIGMFVLFLLSLFGWSAPHTSAGSEMTSSYMPVIVKHSPDLTETPSFEVTATATIWISSILAQ
jgi:hypothetical protein